MFHRILVIALVDLAVAGCAKGVGWKPRQVVLSIPFERHFGSQKLIAGRGQPSENGPFPDAAGLSQALNKCGKGNFNIIAGHPHWEAVLFPSGNDDVALIRCVAKWMPADFAADYTSDQSLGITSKFEPIRGI